MHPPSLPHPLLGLTPLHRLQQHPLAADWSSLPLELLARCMEALPTQERKRLRLVCGRWREAADSTFTMLLPKVRAVHSTFLRWAILSIDGLPTWRFAPLRIAEMAVPPDSY